MSEVLDIEVDGEIERGDGPGHGGPSVQWGVPVAIALAGLLLLAVLVLVVRPTLTGTTSGPRQAPIPESSPPAVPAAEAPASAAISVDRRIGAVQGALAAWGEFVADGDLEGLKPWFVEDGPQYRQLAEEAPGLAVNAGLSYTVTTEDESIVTAGEADAVVATTVTWRHVSEQTRVYQWEVVLRQTENDRWLLWTVRGPSAPS